MDDDLLIALVNDLLTDEDRRDTLSHLRRCEACERRFKEFARLHEETIAGPQPVATDGGIKLETDAPRTPVVSRGVRRRGMGTRAAAVVAVLAAAVVLVMVIGRGRIAPGDALEYWLPVDEEAFVLRSDDSVGGLVELREALDAYSHKNVTGAISMLEHMEPPAGDDTWRALHDLYLASCYLHAGRIDDADRLLAKVDVPTLPSPWWERSMWMTYIVDSGMGREDRAAKTLEQLSTVEGDIGARARRAAGRQRRG